MRRVLGDVFLCVDTEFTEFVWQFLAGLGGLDGSRVVMSPPPIIRPFFLLLYIDDGVGGLAGVCIGVGIRKER